MAVINANTLDNLKRTLFFRLNKKNVPVPLPFDLITIDSDFQAYEPVTNRVGPNFSRQRGSVEDAVMLSRNHGLPRPPQGQKAEQHVVWFYGGI